MDLTPITPFSAKFSAQPDLEPTMSLDNEASVSDLLSRQEELTIQLQSLQEHLSRLVPQLEEAQAQAQKPPEKPQGTSPETLLASATQAALARYEWKAKLEGLEVAIAWTQEQIHEKADQLDTLEATLAEAERRQEQTLQAREGVAELNGAIAEIKRQLIELKGQGCLHLYTVNLPEFSLDEQGQIQVRPHSFRIQ
jgi:chromosome segregation ATPase